MKGFLSVVGLFLLFSANGAARVSEGDLLQGVSPGPDGKIDVLTVYAHQDDESISSGGALLKLKHDPRVRLHLLCLTLGDMSEAKDRLEISSERLGQIRTKELETAAVVLEADEVIQFQYHDQGLTSADQEKLIEEIREVMDRVGAEIVITHDSAGGTGHSDHIICSRVATSAFQRSSAKRLFYSTLPALYSRSLLAFSPFKTKIKPSAPTLRVNVKPEKKLKHLAFYAHASQACFSGVGNIVGPFLRMDHEYYALAGSKE